MPFPDQFYRTVPDSEQRYTYRAAGNRLLPKRLFQGLAPYVRTAFARRKIPKTLVLADWRLSFYSLVELQRLKEEISRLLDAGFPVVLWRENELPITMTHSNLHLLSDKEIHKQVGLPHSAVVQTEAIRHFGLPADHLHVLDDREIDRLVEGNDNLGPRRLYLRHGPYVFDGNKVVNTPEMQKFQTFLQEADPPFEKVVNSLVVGDKGRRTKHLAKFIPIHTLKLVQEDINLLCEYGEFARWSQTNEYDMLPSHEVIIKGGMPLHSKFSPAFSNLQYLQFEDTLDIKPSDFIALTASQHLKHLILQRSAFKEMDAVTQPLHESWNKTLETLVIDSLKGDFPQALVETILNKSAKTIRHLTLKSSDATCHSIKLPEMPELESMVLCGNSSKAIDATNPLLATPNVKRLYLTGSDAGSNLNTLLKTNKRLDALEELHLEGIGFFTKFHILFQTANKLKHLRLININIGDTPITKMPESLETFHLGSINPTSYQDLMTDILISPKLHTLELSAELEPSDIFMKQIELIHILKNCKPPSLETIILRNMFLSTKDLSKLVLAYPNLKTLDLRHCYFDATLLPANFFPLHLTVHLPLARDPVLATSSVEVPATPPVAAPFDTQFFANFKPHEEEYEFNYKGENQSLNQAMVIEKLSQYLTLTNQHKAYIYRLQDGICNALSHGFLQEPQWQDLLSRMQKWNGKPGSLNANSVLREDFDRLFNYVKQYQLLPSIASAPNYYLGDHLHSFLQNNREACILSNPWHAIGIRPHSNTPNSWEIYDPEHPEAVRTVNQDELYTAVTHDLERLVNVEWPHTHILLPVPKIDDLTAFLHNGGLLVLSSKPKLWQQFQRELTQQIWTMDALKGILLRDMKGKPAWFHGLKSQYGLGAFTKQLIDTLLSNPDMSLAFQQSMEHLEGFERLECQTLLVQAASTSTPAMPPVLDLIRNAPKPKNPYLRAFKTWEEHEELIATREAFCQAALQTGNISRRLIAGNSSASTKAMAFSLQKQCIDTHRPVFYIHSPDDLICKADFIVRQADNSGVSTRGSGGPLHDFLTRHAADGSSPVLVVNYDNFEPDDLVRFNALLDKTPFADGTPLPAGTQVIGLLNRNNPDCYQGSDFYTRFQRFETCSLPLKTLQDATPVLRFEQALPEDTESDDIIHLFHATDWKERLLGRWILDGESLRYQDGVLQDALKKGTRLRISQGLWDLPDFGRFWEEALLRGSIPCEGQLIDIPADLAFVRLDHYPFENLRKWLHDDSPAVPFSSSSSSSSVVSTAPFMLNPSVLMQFFEHDSIKDNLAVNRKGLIELHANSRLPIYLTRDLCEDEWAMLLYECKKWQVHLDVRCAPSVTTPTVLELAPSQPLPEMAWDYQTNQPVTVIQSTDPDTSIAQIITKGETWQVMDITECDTDDLLESIRIAPKVDAPGFNFTVQQGALLKGLAKGENILLRGRFSKDLIDNLAALLQNHQGPGRIAIVGEGDFSFLPLHIHRVSDAEKSAQLPKVHRSVLKDYINNEPLATLKARSRWLMQNPGGNSDDTFRGLKTLAAVPPLAPFDPLTSEVGAEAFIDARKKQLDDAFINSPYVFLAGLSGVGKSTFIKEVYCDSANAPYTNIKEWVTSTKPGRKLLFLDEATLQRTDWSIFEGLFANPPGIMFEGTYYPLSNEHKVIFAGNPVSYGDERKLANLFARHGNSVVFDPLPLAFLYERILKPLLAPAHLGLAPHFLEAYKLLVSFSSKDVLITPRELEMMVLLTLSKMAQHPDLDPQDVARHYAYLLAKPLVPTAHKTSFDNAFKPAVPLEEVVLPETPGFLVTPSRKPVCSLLHDLLGLRNYRRTLSADATHTQLYGGLGGLVIEGPPGVGKSELVIHSLIAHGLQEIHDLDAPFPNNGFVRMPASLSLEEKKDLLVRAFYAGAVVVADEINCSPMMEAFLNDLLMGKAPALNPPQIPIPGFMLIGTQNPVTMGGRLPQSTALGHRFVSCDLQEYPEAEIKDILRFKGVREDDAILMTEAFLQQVAYARAHNKQPEPGFRTLMDVAEACVLSYSTAVPVLASPGYQYGLTGKTSFFQTKREEASDDTLKVQRNNQHRL